MAKYKLLKDYYTGKLDNRVFHETKGTIPFDEANTDYQEYLEWVSTVSYTHLTLPTIYSV